MQSPIRSRILEDAKDRILEQRDNALQCQSVHPFGSPAYEYWLGASEWLEVAAQIIDECMEDN